MSTIAMEEYELMKDSKYRMYVAAVDKALKNFEYTSEWADLISALGKLNKVLLSYTKFPVIPRRIKISKRLAQCMHPALPSGVHLKALETYDVIFKCMGTNRLSYELFIYSAGLFPLLGHAAMNVRPSLLTVYETHFVPLGERLRPALSGFLSGVLPGLESGSDHFDRTNSLLEKVCDGVGAAWFYTCVWQCVRSNSPVRLPAISFVLVHCNRKMSMEDQLYLMGNDIDVMVSGLCAAVQDSSVLVQRSALELLMVGFPMHNTQLLYADMVRLVTAALVTILRRDMSLNRRLYSWLLGSEVNVSLLNSEHPLVKKTKQLSDTKSQVDAYFELYSFDILSEAIRVILTQSSMEVSVDIKPYRLLTTLFDKPQIGPVILDNILYDIFRALYLSCLNQDSSTTGNGTARCVSFNGDLQSLKSRSNILTKQFLTRSCQELTKNANLLFNTLETFYVWTYLGKLYECSTDALKDSTKSARNRCQVNDIGCGKPELLEICILTDFLLDVIPIETYADNTSEILPNLFIKIVYTMKERIEVLNQYEISQSLQLCTKILTKIQPITIKQFTTEIDISASVNITDVQIFNEHNSTMDSNSSALSSLNKSTSKVNVDSDKELKLGLEKSKSDSKINENIKKSELTIDLSRERSNSNQMLKKLQKSSPKIDKKSKNKKSKSSSKLYDLKKDEHNESATSLETTLPIGVDIKDEIIEIKTTPIHVTTRVENKHIFKCLEVFKVFYVDFVTTKIVPDVNIINAFKKLVQDKDDRTQSLEKLLNTCLNTDNTEFQPVVVPSATVSDNKKIISSIVSNNSKCVDYENAMNLASNILLEFSAFSNLLSEEMEEVEIPFWLKVLIVTCCCLPKSTKDIQLIAMNALLEIFSLAKSQFVNKDVEDTNAILVGILPNAHVNFIEDSTYTLEVMAQILWDLLGSLSNQNQIILCTTLLYQIHNVFDTKLFVENVISRYLINETLSVEFFKRFNLLWHLGRDLEVKISANQNNVRSFDRCLLKILDNLRNIEKTNLKLLSENFLVHSLLRNDISRIMNPIFTILLNANTSRISITHINLHNSDVRSDGNSESVQKIEDAKLKKIYAISSVNGNVMYHVTDGPLPKPTKLKNFLFSKNNKKPSSAINMTTSITENSNVITKKNRDFKNVDINLNTDRASKNNVKLFINPLSSKEIYPNGITGSYVKLDSNHSEKSSSESLSSSIDVTQTSTDSAEIKNIDCLQQSCSYNTVIDRDSGFESTSNEFGTKSRQNSEGKSRNSLEKEMDYTSKLNLSNYLEQMATISDGISDENCASYPPTINQKLPKSQSLEEAALNGKITENLSLIHSWSYSISDSEKLDAELELSTPAEDFFQSDDHTVVHEILSDILDTICRSSDTTTDSTIKTNELNLKAKITEKAINVYPMHCHICLYCNVFDSELVLYSLQTLKNCIQTNPQLFIKCLATTGLQNVRNNDILNLFARHRKSIFGLGFYGEVNSEYINFFRGFMFLEAVISVCLNYARSFYPNLDNRKLNEYEINNNLKIQLASLEILEIVVKNLIIIVNENSKGFSSYIADMLIKCKLQKILLHCLLTSVRNFDNDMTFAEEILLFNHFQLYVAHNRVCEHVEAFQIQLLRLMQSLIVLEFQVFPNAEPTNVQQANSPKIREHLTYTPTILIPQQQMFLSAIMSALRHQNMKSLHQNWCNMVTFCLPYFGSNLKQISVSVIHQICNNIEKIAENYKNTDLHGELMTDYATTQLEALTVVCHYCLLDSSQSVNLINLPSSTVSPLTNPGEIFNNFLNVFLPPVNGDMNLNNKQNTDAYQNARKTILSHMPRIISSIAKLWQMISNIDGDFNGVYGSSKTVKQQLLEFLSPIAIHHGSSFLAAIGVAWYERRNPFSGMKTVLPEPNQNQMNLVCLISAIRVIPIDNLVQTVTLVIKNPPPTEGLSADICLDVSVLELFYCYMRNAPTVQLQEAWNSLLTLVREGCSLAPPAQFLLAALLHELIIKCCPVEERKDQKDLQDVTAKLIECVSQVCGSCLEQTTWLRRNLAVREQEDDNVSTATVSTTGSTNDLTAGSYNVQAQLVLAEILAPIVDICFGSSEKDKVNTILTSLMYNIVPYLRNHTVRNMSSYLACSKLLASLSSYQYTRKAWRKDVFDLLLDNSFFQMDYSCLKYWKVIIDNLMTHDNTTFRDLMSRVSMTQSGSLSLFSSREQEYEQKAQLLKRLAFVILCSETDQYSKYMPDIQEQLANSLRLCVPGVQAQVFLCFRVLLIRMSPIHVTSLWPIIINEMLQVFLQIEQELATDTEEFRTNSSWATNSSNGLHALGHPHWLRLQLATAQLLDLALLLPATSLPQFQMYVVGKGKRQ